MRDLIIELCEMTKGLNIVAIELIGKDGNVEFSAIESVDKSLIIKGKLLKKYPQLNGVRGLRDLDWLSKIAKIYDLPTDLAAIAVIPDSILADAKTDKEQLVFKRADGMSNTCVLMDHRIIPKQYEIKKLTWDVKFEPQQAAIDILTLQNKAGREHYFSVHTEPNENGGLDLWATMGQNEHTRWIFQRDVGPRQIQNEWCWETAMFLKIFKLSKKALYREIRIVDEGCISIIVRTALAEYDFFMPATAGK